MAKKTHELALCGVLCALAVAFLWLSGVIPLSTYAWPILASATLLPAREECRKSYAWSCFAAAAVLGLLLCADKEAALVFCFLGYYPLVKPNLDAISSKALRLFAKLGLAEFADEKMMSAAGTLAGCGPAFAAIFLESMADGGVACGLPRASAIQYAAQMMLGTAKMVLETNQHPGVLKDSVCSPAGSTIQGVRTLEERGMRAAVLDAVTVAYEKNVELKKASD